MPKALREKHFYMKFDVGAWRKDPAVSSLSSLARGIWFELLGAMHEQDRCGRLSGTVEVLARLGRCTEAEMRTTLDELKAHKTGDVTFGPKNVTVTNRKMRREFETRTGARVRQQKRRSKQCLSQSCHNDNDFPSESESKSESSISISKSDSDGDAALRQVTQADLADVGRLMAWISSAVAAGLLNGSEEESIRLVALAQRCCLKGKHPANLFRSMFRAGQWDHITGKELDAASKMLREFRRGKGAPSSQVFLKRTEAASCDE